MGNSSEFRRAVQLVLDNVSFNRCTTVQVFEATIRYVLRCHVWGEICPRQDACCLAHSLPSPPLPSPPRVLGSLLSAHLLIQDPQQPFGALSPDGYEGELLELAHNLAGRLLPAFENTSTGIPYTRVCSCVLDVHSLSSRFTSYLH